MNDKKSTRKAIFDKNHVIIYFYKNLTTTHTYKNSDACVSYIDVNLMSEIKFCTTLLNAAINFLNFFDVLSRQTNTIFG